MSSIVENKKGERKKEGFFLENGAAVLEQLITLHNGGCNPIRSYSARELQNATGNFRWLIYRGWNYKLFKGIYEDREISVKSFQVNRYSTLERIAKEVAIASRMSNHKNVLKLFGCCLETELPLLVYDFPSNGNLDSYIYTKNQQQQLPWDIRLRIVSGIANAVAYLHHGLAKMIIHRNITPENIFLDQNNVVKLFDFQDAMLVPEDETDVETDVCGTCWYLAPEVAMYGRQTEKYDVYSFGVLLSSVLIQKRFNELLSWHMEISNKKNADSGIESNHDHFWEGILAKYCEIYEQEENRVQVLEYVKLVQSCIKENPKERPDMIEVEKALRLIKNI